MKRVTVVLSVAAVCVGAGATPAFANHSWGGYHWARTTNPFTIKLGDNLASGWKSYLQTASSDWTASTVMDTTIVPGQANRRCRPTSGRVEVCNGSYGQNGWLGLAQIWLSSSGHIRQGTVQVNDTYFALSQYNFTTERLHVMCQEVGHTFGLDHQDTSGASLNTCMDYYRNTSNSDTKSTHPNKHDYDELALIYQHLDSTTAIGSEPAGPAGDPPVNLPGAREAVYATRLADGGQLLTFVFWANPVTSAP